MLEIKLCEKINPLKDKYIKSMRFTVIQKVHHTFSYLHNLYMPIVQKSLNIFSFLRSKGMPAHRILVLIE